MNSRYSISNVDNKFYGVVNITYDTSCPKCGESENLHNNYDYEQEHRPVIDVLCNACGGEDVLFAPEKSILSNVLEAEYKNYLVGPEKNRVSSIRLRGELSCGIIIPNELVFAQCGKNISELPNDEDLSELLGITKYIPKVPSEMSGLAVPIEYDKFSIKHDVEQFGVYASNFIEGERVIATEKLHGSQLVFYVSFQDGTPIHKWVSTKNYNSEGLCLVENPSNFYWMAVNNVNLLNILSDMVSQLAAMAGVPSNNELVVHVFGEAIPCQALKYGFVNPTFKIFGISLNGKTYPYDRFVNELRDLWVPILYDGPYENVSEIKKLALGNETVSGNNLHIKEGIVIAPYENRRAADGTWLKVKVINPKYKETGEELN